MPCARNPVVRPGCACDERLGTAATVRTRAVFYIPGYDPRPPAVYHALLAGGLLGAAPHRGFTAEVGPLLDDGAALLPISAQVAGAGWRTEISLVLLRWDDVLRRSYARSVWPRLPAYAGLAWHLAAVGLFRRALAADYRFFAFLIYPFLATVLSLAAVLGASLAAGLWVEERVPAAGWLLTVLLVGAGCCAFDRIERRSFVRYLLEDWLFTFRLARGDLPEMDARLDVFVDALTAAVRDEAFDEVLLVGHSTGSYLAVEVVARALDRAPGLAAGRSSVSLLTVGSLVALMAMYPPAGSFRRRVAALAHGRAIPWMEVQARHDVISLPWTDPLGAAGIARADAGPPLYPLLLRMNLNSAIEGVKDTLAQRLRLFSIHFRYFSIKPPQGRFDIFGVIGGPLSLPRRYPELLRATAGPDSAAPLGPLDDRRPRPH